MIVVCSQCATRLQLDDAKVPQRAFTVRCPKCQSIIHGQPATATNGQQSALGLGETPALDNGRYNPPVAAPAFKTDNAAKDEEVQSYGDPSAEPKDLARLLAELLQQGAPATV